MSQRGFTIIELLVVLAIIGLLISGVLVGLSQARIRAQDTRRMEDIGQLQRALALYATTFHRYPIAAATTTLTGTDTVSTALISAEAIPAIPKDPNASRSYQYSSTGASYLLEFCLDTNAFPPHGAHCNNTVAP